MLSVALLVCAVAGSPAPAEASATSPAAPVVTSDDRAAAATTSGIGAFVGVALGGVVVPGTAGLIGGFIGLRPSASDQLLLTTIGGAAGAAAGGILGAIPTTEPWIGEPAVGAAAALGALVGLVPAMIVAQQKPKTSDPNDPIRLAQSACLFTAVAAASGAAAGAGALLAAPKARPAAE